MRSLATLLASPILLALVTACSDVSDNDRKTSNQAERKAKLEALRQEQTAKDEARLSTGATLLSRSTVGEVTIEVYEIPRHRFLITGSTLGVATDICVVYSKRGTSPLMDCYRTESD